MDVMKIFRHLLMGNEIFFKIFDGPQNILLYSIFVILFFTLGWLEHKLSKLAIKEIRERQGILNKSHPLIHSADIRQIVVKIKKCLIHFDPDARVFVLSNRHKTQLFVKVSLVIFICLTTFSKL